jgi:hypothetical protein
VTTRGHLNKTANKQLLTINSIISSSEASVSDGDMVGLNGIDYQVQQVTDRDRLMVLPQSPLPERISGFSRVHCGYHKCLTMYYRKVFSRLSRFPFYKGKFRHFYHRSDVFFRECNNYGISSVSGHVIDTSLFEDVRISRFIRDPRDLLISGYFYHKRSAERWCDIIDPTDEDWGVVQGVVPSMIPAGMSFAQFLNSVSLEQGLMAEIEFRRKHFISMLEWPEDNHQIKTFRYEDILGNEKQTFEDLFSFYELPTLAKKVGVYYADRYSARKKSGKQGHIRDPRAGQWNKHFTPALMERFNAEYSSVLERYHYPQ